MTNVNFSTLSLGLSLRANSFVLNASECARGNPLGPLLLFRLWRLYLRQLE